MKGMRAYETAALAAAAALMLSCMAASMFRHRPENAAKEREHIRCIISINEIRDTSRALLTGYNYDLLERFALGRSMSVEIVLGDSTAVDSLRRGCADLIAVPFGPVPDSLISGVHIDSTSMLLCRPDDADLLESFGQWYALWQEREESGAIRDAFLNRYDVFRSRPRAMVSPYDSLIRRSADSLGLDWRLLAAIIYKESRFHIEARSPRGASGLMQMMPSTARRYGIEDPLSPSENIDAGARLLANLLKRYSSVCPDPAERSKFALAAYNAGIGRIQDMISLAQARGIGTERWEDVITVIPEMSDEAILEEGIVRNGTFKGRETIAYVERVFEIYGQICRISIE